jgi:uncharacterized protein YkwD
MTTADINPGYGEPDESWDQGQSPTLKIPSKVTTENLWINTHPTGRQKNALFHSWMDSRFGLGQNHLRLSSLRLRWISLAVVTLGLVSCAPTDANLERLIELIPSVTRIGREPPPESATASNAQSSATAEMEHLVYEQINQRRQEAGLNPLRPNGPLAEVARQYSQRMAEEDFFGHVSPTGDSPAQRVSGANIPYWIVGENLFTSTNAPAPAPLSVQSWMDSPGHRANILRSSFTETGVGVWQRGNTFYFTQLFMRPL